MRRKIGAAAVLLAVVVSCRDGPTLPVAADDDGAAELSTAQRSAIRDAWLAVSRGVTDGELSAMHRALTTARRQLIGPTDGEDAVVRAALDLVLDDAETSLENHERTVEPITRNQLQ